jgi:capsular polysaccharide biosynthesis protein
VVVITMVVVAIGLAWATTTVAPVAVKGPTRQYQASTTLLSIGGGSPGFTNLQTMASLTTLPDVAKRVANDIHYSGDPQDLARAVSAFGAQQTGLLTITATSTNPARAKVLADTFSVELLTFLKYSALSTNAQESAGISRAMKSLNSDINALDNQIVASSGVQRELLSGQLNAKVQAYNSLQSQLQSLSAQSSYVADPLVIIQRAVPTLVPASSGFQAPRSRRARVLLALVAGLVIGVALALVLERFDTHP